MPTTAELIEGMTDGGRFEELALAILRRMRPTECAALIHNGVNSKGETIPFLVDAEGFVPGSDPPRYVMVQFTKTKRKELKRKWLFDYTNPENSAKNLKNDRKYSKPRKPSGPNDDGDLIKAIRRVEAKRKEFPQASFKVYLVSNLLGVGDVESSVTAVGQKAGVETEVVEAGRLSDFLNNEPEAQPIRFNFFGTPITHVSSDWLIGMSRTLLLQRQTRQDFETATKRIRRACATDLQTVLAIPSSALIWVTAPPGKGKSIVSVDAITAHVDEGGFALWLSENDVEGAELMWQAVDSAIRRDSRSLEPDAGKQLLRLATRSTRLVLLLDDLNRLQNPEVAFQKVRNWVRSASTTDNNANDQSRSISSFVILCPIWPQHLDKLNGSRAIPIERPSWEHVFEVPNFLAHEAASIFSTAGLSSLEVQTIAGELDFDPLLCSIAAKRIDADKSAKLTATRETVRWYLERQMGRVVDKTGRPMSEYLVSVRCLAEAMLRAKNLRPQWSCVRAWIGDPETLARLTELFAEHVVIYCDGASEIVLFNHDRFLDTMCAEAIPALLDQTDVCADPYFAEIIGRAIAEDRLTEAGINRILCINPLAAFCGLMFATNQAVKQKLTSFLIRWAQEKGRDKDLPARLLFEISLILLKTDSPSVAEFPGRLSGVWGLNLAALRNGSANDGLNYCRSYEGHHFLPAVHDARRDAIIDHARSNHAVRLVADLSRDLEQPGLPVEFRNASLVLAGFLGFEELAHGIEQCWHNCPSNEQPEIVASAVWAIVRCAKRRFEELLPRVFEVWQRIPDEGADNRYHPRSDIAFYALSHCPPTWIPELVAQWLIKVLPSYPDLKSSLDYLLTQIDVPSAFDYQVRCLATRKRETGGSSAFYFMLRGRWDTERRYGYSISEPSRVRLRTIWSNELELPEERECAFRFWLLHAVVSELAILRSIKPENPLYEPALRRRMQLYDRTTLPELFGAFRNDFSLLQDLPPVWSRELHETTIAVFQAARESLHHREDGIAAFLLSLPRTDAGNLLIALWPECGANRGFQVAALLMDNDKANELVKPALSNQQTGDSILRLANFVIGATWPYLDREEMLPVWLERCVPYLQYASQQTLKRFGHLCNSPVTWKWYENHVRLLRKPESFDDLDRRMDLENMEANYRNNRDLDYGAHCFFEEVERRGLEKKGVLKRIANETLATPTIDNAKWLAASIGVAGDRQDVSLFQQEYKGVPIDLTTKLKTDCLFAVMRRSLN